VQPLHCCTFVSSCCIAKKKKLQKPCAQVSLLSDGATFISSCGDWYEEPYPFFVNASSVVDGTPLAVTAAVPGNVFSTRGTRPQAVFAGQDFATQVTSHPTSPLFASTPGLPEQMYTLDGRIHISRSRTRISTHRLSRVSEQAYTLDGRIGWSCTSSVHIAGGLTSPCVF